MTSTTLPPDVADLLRVIHGALNHERGAAHVQGVLAVLLEGQCEAWNAASALRRFYMPAVCDTCHTEPVTVLDGDRRQCSTCALRVCDCCQVRRATVTWGVTELCPLCAEERAAEAEVAYAP